MLEMLPASGASYSQSNAGPSGVNTFPSAGTMRRSASNAERLSFIMPLKPLNTDSTIISAAVPIAMPAALIADIRLITPCDFFAKR